MMQQAPSNLLQPAHDTKTGAAERLPLPGDPAPPHTQALRRLAGSLTWRSPPRILTEARVVRSGGHPIRRQPPPHPQNAWLRLISTYVTQAVLLVWPAS